MGSGKTQMYSVVSLFVVDEHMVHFVFYLKQQIGNDIFEYTVQFIV